MELGRLEDIHPRQIWANEARDFTPWLLMNGDRLADALGIDLELSAAEHPVGGFSLDLIGHDLTNDAVLMIENQLEATDHGHLGQLLTYAAGTDAATIVWIATNFREEHRQAIDWLNEQTTEQTHFFAVQIRVLRIGGSQPAPHFELIAKPNDWQRQIRTATRAGSTSERGEQYRAFWTRYLEVIDSHGLQWGRRSAKPYNWMNFSGPFTGTNLNPVFSAGRRIRHELYIDSGDADANMALFEVLASHRAELDREFGQPLEYAAMEGKQACRIAFYRDDAAVDDQDRWDEYIAWFIDTGRRLRSAFRSVAPAVDDQLAALETM